MDLQLTGKVAIVTGASAGIGQAIAHAFTAEGMEVILVARRAAELERLANELTSRGPGDARVIACDLADRAATVVVESNVGSVDILVNCAGGSRPLSTTAPDEAWDEAMELNFVAPRRLTQALLPRMIESGWGRVISITGSSEPKPQPLPDGSGFTTVNGANAAKAAVHAWSKGISREVARHGITVNCVAPGRIMSEQIEDRLHPSEDERLSFAAEEIPIGRFGEPDDVADLVRFLAAPRAGYITGEIFHVDGGLRRYAF